MIKPIAVALILLTPSAHADVDLPRIKGQN